MSRAAASARDAGRIRVWDPLLRTLHWALAAGVALGWATTFWFGGWHQAVGWSVLGIALLRIAWGFVGPRHSRFAQFVRGVRPTWRYAGRLLRGDEPRHLGHNPLGAAMVLAMFGCIAALALTGWLYTTDRFWGDETVERIHLALAWALLALVVLHVGGVALASWRHRENLVAAMWSGDKRAPQGSDVD